DLAGPLDVGAVQAGGIRLAATARLPAAHHAHQHAARQQDSLRSDLGDLGGEAPAPLLDGLCGHLAILHPGSPREIHLVRITPQYDTGVPGWGTWEGGEDGIRLRESPAGPGLAAARQHGRLA